MLQVRLNGFPVEPFAGVGVPNTGGLLSCNVVNVYHRRVYRPLPPGSVAFTQTLYDVEYANPDNDNDFVPFDAPEPLLVCPLLHWIVQLNVFPSGSLIGMLHEKLKGLFVEPFVGVGVPNTGGRFVFVVKTYHRLVYCPLPPGSVAFTHTL
jgi:hypothetical protein